jgi:hypothetical protein
VVTLRTTSAPTAECLTEREPQGVTWPHALELGDLSPCGPQLGSTYPQHTLLLGEPSLPRLSCRSFDELHALHHVGVESPSQRHLGAAVAQSGHSEPHVALEVDQQQVGCTSANRGRNSRLRSARTFHRS